MKQTSIVINIEQSVRNLIDQHKFLDLEIAEPETSDKWLLASNLQKSIRRGLLEPSLGTAIKLHSVDAKYFWRRILVIAYEDIGFADLNLCFYLMRSFRREAMHECIGSLKIITYFITKLCQAEKNRMLCDLIAQIEFSIHRRTMERIPFMKSDSDLVEIATNQDKHHSLRMYALRHICGYQEFTQGRYQKGASQRKDLMQQVAENVGLSYEEAALFKSGQGISDSMNVAVPIVAGYATKRLEQTPSEPLTTETYNGVLLCALDRHTRLGKRCLTDLANSNAHIQNYFKKFEDVNVINVLGIALFISEGSILKQSTLFKKSNKVVQDFNFRFLEHAGISCQEHQQEVLELLATCMGDLNRIRKIALAS